MLRFDKATYLSILFMSFLFARLSNSSRGSDVLLFLEFTNIVSILFYSIHSTLSNFIYCYIYF